MMAHSNDLFISINTFFNSLSFSDNNFKKWNNNTKDIAFLHANKVASTIVFISTLCNPEKQVFYGIPADI